MKEFTKSFLVPLTDAERIELGNELAEKRMLMAQLVEKKKSIMEDYKKQIDGLDAEVLAKSRMIKSGKASKEINCYVVFDDPAKNKKSYYRAESDELFPNELIEIVDMTPEEIGDPNQLNAFVSEESEDQPLNYFLNIYGFDPNVIEYEEKEVFVASNPSDLEEHDIPEGEIDKVQGCLLVKSSHEAIKEIFSNFSFMHKLMTDSKGVFWYAFPALPNSETEGNY